MRTMFKGALVALALFAGWAASPHMTFQSGSIASVGFEFNTAEAKKFGSSFSSSRSFSSSKPSFSSSRPKSPSFSSSSRKSSGSSGLWNRSSTSPKVSTKPSATTVSSTSPKVTTGKTTKPTTTATRTGGFGSKTGAAGSALAGTNASKGLKDYRSETSKFNKPSTTNTMANADKYKKSPVMSRNKPTTRVTYNVIQDRRSSYYGGWNRPNYMYSSYNTFGMWDAAFLWYMMSNNPAFFYHHGNSAEVREFRAEADRLSQDNAELRAQLNQLDGKVKGMTGPRDEAFLPEGVDPAVAFVPELVAQGEGDGTIRIGTGGKTGTYYAFCQELARHYAKTECVNTNGSAENREGFLNGKFGAVTIQSNFTDGMGGLQASLYPEVVFLLVNSKTDMTSIADFDTVKHNLYVAGSGAYGTLENFVQEDSNYGILLSKAQKVSPTNELVDRIAADPNGAMMFVCSVNCPLLEYANSKYDGELQLAAVDDWNFNDATDSAGNYLYRFVELDEDVYGNLMEGGWVTSGDVETLAVEAVFAISEDWVAINGSSAKEALETTMWPALAAIQKRAGLPAE